MTDLTRRRDIELARCTAALLSAHAHLCQALAARLGDRLPADRVVELYSRAHDLSPLDEAWIRIHTLAHSVDDVTDGPANGRPRTSWSAVRDAVRTHIAPLGDPALQETLAYEFARAGAVLLKVHVRNAVSFAEALSGQLTPAAAVAQYIDRVDMPAGIRGAVHALALTRLNAARELPRIVAPQTGRQLAPAGPRH